MSEIVFVVSGFGCLSMCLSSIVLVVLVVSIGVMRCEL